jgi:hypothetical protein
MLEKMLVLHATDGFNVGTLPLEGLVIIRLPFVDMQQPTGPADPGRIYALSPTEARVLARQILEQCDLAESAQAQPSGNPQH